MSWESHVTARPDARLINRRRPLTLAFSFVLILCGSKSIKDEFEVTVQFVHCNAAVDHVTVTSPGVSKTNLRNLAVVWTKHRRIANDSPKYFLKKYLKKIYFCAKIPTIDGWGESHDRSLQYHRRITKSFWMNESGRRQRRASDGVHGVLLSFYRQHQEKGYRPVIITSSTVH